MALLSAMATNRNAIYRAALLDIHLSLRRICQALKYYTETTADELMSKRFAHGIGRELVMLQCQD